MKNLNVTLSFFLKECNIMMQHLIHTTSNWIRLKCLSIRSNKKLRLWVLCRPVIYIYYLVLLVFKFRSTPISSMRLFLGRIAAESFYCRSIPSGVRFNLPRNFTSYLIFTCGEHSHTNLAKEGLEFEYLLLQTALLLQISYLVVFEFKQFRSMNLGNSAQTKVELCNRRSSYRFSSTRVHRQKLILVFRP